MNWMTKKFQPQILILKQWHKKYESYLPALFFSLGFLLDIITLGEVDDLSNMLILSFYLFVGIGILSLEYLEIEDKTFKISWANKAFTYRDDAYHFFLGALLSAFTLFYFKSGSLSNSFLFMLFMVALLLLNEIEIFRKKGIVIRSALLMLCFVSYLIYMIPILLGKSDSYIFAFCIVFSLGISYLSFYLLTKFNKSAQRNIRQLLIPQFSIILIFTGLYIFKILPPIPLSLKHIGIYHEIEKVNGQYITKRAKKDWSFFSDRDYIFNARSGDKIYLFTKIFSPGGFEETVYIHWLYDTGEGLKTSDRIPLSVTGGRVEGFRGYAYKSNYISGSWQVRIETQAGLEIGRINFEIKNDTGTEPRELVPVSHKK